MKRKIDVYFRVSIWGIIAPVVIYFFLYFLPGINYFFYVDNVIFIYLWEMKWLRFMRFVSSPLAIILFFLMLNQRHKIKFSTKDKIILSVQGVLAAMALVYWFVILRIIFMI
jgi:hypothetical protein